MESVFSRFDSYDFGADRRFQDGLKSLHETSRDQNKELDMKLFYYNRFVEPIDRSSYKQWSAVSPRVTPTVCERPDQPTRPDSGCDISEKQPAEAERLSFAEVMQLVQEGKEVPGAVKLDVKPTNQSPTASQMERILKPWEVSSASK